MSQDYQLPVGSDARSTAIKTLIPGCLEALRTDFSGATAPTSPSTYQKWIDTSTQTIKQWNGAAWVVLGPALQTQPFATWTTLGSVSASANHIIGVAPARMVVERVVLVSGASTTSDSSDYWEFALRNLTTTNYLTLVLQSTDGVEVTANTGYPIPPDQNEVMEVNEVLQLEITKNGSATTLTNAAVLLVGYLRGV